MDLSPTTDICPNRSIKILITDAIEDLQNGDRNAALTHSNLALRELSSANKSSSPSPTHILLNDAIKDIQNGNIDTARTHLSLASQQLGMSSDGAVSTPESASKISEHDMNITRASNATGSHPIVINTCSDGNYDGVCDTVSSSVVSNRCDDNDFNGICEWYYDIEQNRTIQKQYQNGTLNVNSSAEGVTGTSNATGEPVFNFLTFEDPALGVKIQYPSVLGYSGKSNFGDATNLLFANGLMDFTVTIEDTPSSGLTSLGLLQKAIESLKESVGKNFKVIDSDTVNLLGQQAYKLVFTGGGDSKSMQTGTAIDNILYEFRYSPHIQYYDFYLPAVERMIGSFEITGKPSTLGVTSSDNFSSAPNFASSGTNTTSQFFESNQTSSQQPFLQQPQIQQNRINWGEICMNPLVDYVITEPCTALTSPDGYTLTAEGERVLSCLAGGALVGLLAPELLTQIRQLGPAVNCGG